MSKKVLLSLLVVCGFVATESVVAKEKKQEFKYKTSYGDVSRAFMSDIVGNTKGYLYDFAKNFKKYPEVFATVLAAVVPYALYKDEVNNYVKDFVYGVVDKDGKVVSPDHKKELMFVWVGTMVAAYIAKDTINEMFFAEEDHTDSNDNAEDSAQKEE